MFLAGEDNPTWAGDAATYSAKHRRIRDQRGTAKEYCCIDCGAKARQWSHRHDTDDGDPFNYDPRCVPCHKVYDQGVIVSPRREQHLNLQSGYSQPGEKHGMAKLTEEMVREIRAIASTGQCTQQELGEIFGVSQTAVSHIILRKTWAWLND